MKTIDSTCKVIALGPMTPHQIRVYEQTRYAEVKLHAPGARRREDKGSAFTEDMMRDAAQRMSAAFDAQMRAQEARAQARHAWRWQDTGPTTTSTNSGFSWLFGGGVRNPFGL